MIGSCVFARKRFIMYLGSAAADAGRRNNFNLIRLLAATCVLSSHSFALSTGDPANEPFAQSLSINLGSLAVVVFFITSGYLVGGSLLSRGEPSRFVVSRAARIYPALIVVSALTALVLGPLLSTSTPASYFARSGTYRYLLTNATAIFGTRFYLPGVFDHTPYRGTVNGALWTLKFELWMYAVLLVTWLATASRGHRRMFAAIVLSLVTVGTVHYWQRPELQPAATNGLGKLGWLTPMFFLGVGAYLLRGRILMHWSIALLAGIILLASVAGGPLVFKAAYPLCLAYLVLFVVYGVPVIDWVLHADYSYGLYIYAFVVQQTLAYCIPGITAVWMTALALPISLACAALSWHLIEKPSLARVDRVAARLRSSVTRLRFGAAPAA